MKKFIALFVVVGFYLSLTGCMSTAIVGTKMLLNKADESREAANVSIIPGKEHFLRTAKTFSVKMKNLEYENQMIQGLTKRNIFVSEKGDVLIRGQVTSKKNRVIISFRFIAKNGETIGTASFNFHKKRRDAPDKILDSIVRAIRDD